MPPIITSLTNPRIKHAVALRDKKTRDADRLMLIEGYDDLSLAVTCLPSLRALFYCPALFKIPDGEARAFRQTCAKADAEPIEVTEPVFRKIAYRDGPDGWLAVAPQPDLSLERLNPTKPNPLIVIAERVEKPGNLGAILRTADAAGADAVIVCDPIADLTNPNVVRASIGALFSVPVATATNAETLDGRARADCHRGHHPGGDPALHRRRPHRADRHPGRRGEIRPQPFLAGPSRSVRPHPDGR